MNPPLKNVAKCTPPASFAFAGAALALTLMVALTLALAASPVSASAQDTSSQHSQHSQHSAEHPADHSQHTQESTGAATPNPASIHIRNLENSPRHHEWVDIPVPPLFSDDPQNRSIKTFIAYPERSDASLVVMVIHENRGLTDWVRSMADQIAAAGYLAVAPDLLSDFSEDYGETRDFPDQDAARTALYELNPDQIMKDMAAVWNHVAVNISNTGQLAVAGFCWGGTQTFRYAAFSSGVQAAFVFYGSSPTEPSDYNWIAESGTDVYGFYAENDERINNQLPETERMAAEAGMTFEPVIYAGSGHAFMRLGEEAGASEANVKARGAAWERLKALLAKTEAELEAW